MTFDFSTSLSGLRAQSTRLAVSADNVANARSIGRREDGSSPVETPYVPRQVSDVAVAPAGVRSEVTEVDPTAVPSYRPDSELADSKGFVPIANVNLEAELVDQIVAERAYQANLAVIRTQDEMTGTLLDTLS